MPAMNNVLLDLPSKQRERYTLAGLIGAVARGDQREQAFFRECSDAIAEKIGRPPQSFTGFLVDFARRDLTVNPTGQAGNNATGAYLVNQRLDFAGALYAASVTSKLPMRRITARDDAKLTVTTTAATATWLADEYAQISDGALAFGQRAAVAKTVSCVMFISKQMDLQAPAVAGFVEQEAARKLAEAVDVAFISGSGASGEPAGLLTRSGTTSQSGTSLAYSGICSMISAAEGYGGTPHVLLGKDTAKLLRQRAKVTSGEPIFGNGSIDALPTTVSRAVPADAMLVFDPALITDVRFGVLEAVVTPLASSTAFATGAIGIRLMESVDWLIDFPASIAKSTSIT